jgi:anti-sigma factor RsiW
MDHERVRTLLSLYVEGDLAGEEREEVESHLSQCEECAREVRSLERMHETLGGLAEVEAPLGFRDAVWRKIDAEPGWRRWLRRLVLLTPQRLPIEGLAAASALVLIVAVSYLVSTHLMRGRRPEEAVLLTGRGALEEEVGRETVEEKKGVAGEREEDAERARPAAERAQAPTGGARPGAKGAELEVLGGEPAAGAESRISSLDRREAAEGEEDRLSARSLTEFDKMNAAEGGEAVFAAAVPAEPVYQDEPGLLVEAPGAVRTPEGGAVIELEGLGAGQRQLVTLRIRLGVDGSVLDAKAVGSRFLPQGGQGDPAIDSLVVDAVCGWKFNPILVDGEPAQVETTLVVPVSGPGPERAGEPGEEEAESRP